MMQGTFHKRTVKPRGNGWEGEGWRGIFFPFTIDGLKFDMIPPQIISLQLLVLSIRDTNLSLVMGPIFPVGFCTLKGCQFPQAYVCKLSSKILTVCN